MAIEDYLDVDNRPTGEIVDQDTVNSLIREGRIAFDFKDTRTSAHSTPGDVKEAEDDRGLQEYLDSVQENEALVKRLEDMRDQMLADMNIAPTNNDIEEAAKTLGSKDGNITKDIFDKAKVITDPDIFVPNQIGIAPDIGALVGDSVLEGDFKDCAEMTKTVTDGWRVVKNFNDGSASEKHAAKANKSVAEAKKAHQNKLKQLWKFIFNMLWWEQLWARIVIFHLGIAEKIMAKPIDFPFLLFRWKRPIQKNFYKYGPIHIVINRLRIYLLCTVPSRAWKEYSPDPEIQIYDRDAGKMVSLTNFCMDKMPVPECPDENEDPNQKEDDEDRPFDDTEDQEEYMKERAEEQTKDKQCTDCDFIRHPMDKPTKQNIGFSPKCAEAAKIVMDAVYDDALNQGVVVIGDKEVANSLGGILTGNVKDGIDASQR